MALCELRPPRRSHNILPAAPMPSRTAAMIANPRADSPGTDCTRSSTGSEMRVPSCRSPAPSWLAVANHKDRLTCLEVSAMSVVKDQVMEPFAGIVDESAESVWTVTSVSASEE